MQVTPKGTKENSWDSRCGDQKGEKDGETGGNWGKQRVQGLCQGSSFGHDGICSLFYPVHREHCMISWMKCGWPVYYKRSTGEEPAVLSVAPPRKVRSVWQYERDALERNW